MRNFLHHRTMREAPTNGFYTNDFCMKSSSLSIMKLLQFSLLWGPQQNRAGINQCLLHIYIFTFYQTTVTLELHKLKNSHICKKTYSHFQFLYKTSFLSYSQLLSNPMTKLINSTVIHAFQIYELPKPKGKCKEKNFQQHLLKPEHSTNSVLRKRTHKSVDVFPYRNVSL